MRKQTFKKLDLAAQRIADRMLDLKVQYPSFDYESFRAHLMKNRSAFDGDMYDEVNLENVCKTPRQIHYLVNEVMHRLKRGKFFLPRGSVQKIEQMTFSFA